jgi:hypothetical protein
MMKRDMDLIREILLKIEDYPDTDMGDVPKVEGYSEKEIYYNIWLLHDAGFIEAYDLSAGGDLTFFPKRLTWAGCEFLDSARDGRRWKQAKDIMKTTGGFALDVLAMLLGELAKQQAFALLPKQ